MPEERDIEKQLRAAAKQRRAEAGGKFGLHPATRRVLQGEVVRTRGPVASTPRRSLLPRLAWTFGVLLTVAVLAGLLMPALGTAKSKSKMLAQKVPAEAGYTQVAAMPVKNLTEELADRKSMPAEARSAQPVLTAGEPAAAPAAPPVLADAGGGSGSAAPVTSSLRLVNGSTVAPGSVGAMSEFSKAESWSTDTAMTNRADYSFALKADAGGQLAAADKDQRGLQTQGFTSTPNSFGVAASKPAQSLVSTATFDQAGGNLEAAQGNRQNYANNVPARRSRDQVTVADLKVLNNFNFEQDGEVIRIVDQDGSVYTGNVLVASGDAAKQGENVKAAKLEAKKDILGEAERVDGIYRMVTNGVPLPPGLKFVASGTNLSLGQRVLFSGAIVAVPSDTPGVNTAMNSVSDQQLGSRFQNNLKAGNNRLVGRAVTADGQAVDVDAVQVLTK